MITLDPLSPLSQAENHSFDVVTELQYFREQQGLSLDDVSAQLCVSRIYLQAIEEADLSALPERVYVLGFIRAYAQLLGMDASLCVQRFRTEVLKEEIQESLTFLKPLPSEVKPNSRIVTFSTLLLAVLFIVGYGSLKWRDPLPINLPLDSSETQRLPNAPSNSDLSPIFAEEFEEDPMISEEEQNESRILKVSDMPVQESTPSLSPAEISPLPLVAPTAPVPTLSLSFSQSCWIDLKNAQQEVILQKTFQAGETFTLPSTPGLCLKAGNAGGVQIHFKNGDVKNLGKIGEVTTYVSLDEAALSDYLKAHNKTP